MQLIGMLRYVIENQNIIIEITILLLLNFKFTIRYHLYIVGMLYRQIVHKYNIQLR